LKEGKSQKTASSRRETYQSELECPNCKAVCMVTWEEHENPVYARAGFGRRLVSLPESFRKAPDDNAIICAACDLEISRWA
jgi:hypothetical protein